VDDAVAVALKLGAHAAGGAGMLAPASRAAERCVRRQSLVFEFLQIFPCFHWFLCSSVSLIREMRTVETPVLAKFLLLEAIGGLKPFLLPRVTRLLTLHAIPSSPFDTQRKRN
jgi:hypothetical protein